ncbi:E3 ubiquitin-protein ligase XIAP-like [Mercenaria mercenaria]|uniref:E3 ubiquitin-protein ligase XIAP-like n=1 Tax=Mercenaria mercenaria TaxID=6596 RepID=UPI00234F9152|nr:E3 ubiquitin-protein ligase XIAP-like [Mercenaria mercenaria]XP_053393329.1 E3 ubiquitin-protein ligase XIAP-like [Mercenaria mercenaria]
MAADYSIYPCETLLAAEPTSCNVEVVLDAFVTQKGSPQTERFADIKQNELCVGCLREVTKHLRNTLLKHGFPLTATSKQAAINVLKRNRSLFVVQLPAETVVIDHEETVQLLLRKTNRELKRGKMTKRRIDSDIFMSLFLTSNFVRGKDNNSRICKDVSFNDEKRQRKNRKNVTKNKNISALIFQNTDISSLPAVRPRKHHTTSLIDLEVIACPNDSQKYKQPSHPKTNRTEQELANEKYPIQETETDAGQPSFEPYQRPYSSTTNTDHPYTSQHETNVYLASENSHERRAQVNRNLMVPRPGLLNEFKPARYSNYIEQHQRLASFHTPKWTMESKPDPSVLAEWGFFFTGTHDLVRCYHCGIGLKDWVREDDVPTEHVKHSSTCDFLVQRLGKDRVDRIKAALSNSDSGIDIDSTASGASKLPYKIRSPRYQTMEARMASFKNFPTHIQLPVQQLAVAGLFFTGNGDLCRCFTCDGGLKDWSTGDDPIKEHATYFPKCGYINQLKGLDYIRAQQQRRPDTQQQNNGAAGGSTLATQPTQTAANIPLDKLSINDNGYSSFNVSQKVQSLGYAEIDVIYARAELQKKGKAFPTAEDILNILLDMEEEKAGHFRPDVIPQTSDNDLEALAEENDRLSKHVYCMLCVTGEADILFLPCTHHRICHECACDVIYCPVCNVYIQEKVKTYRS